MQRERLIAALEQYRPHDAREAVHLQQMQALALAPFDPCSRQQFDPGHFTASAFVLSPDGGALLLILHRKLQRWLQPGGHIDPGDEGLLAAARREAEEEVRLAHLPLDPRHAGLFDVDVHAIPTLGREPGHAHFDVRFLFRSPVLAFDAAAEVAGARWVPLGEVPTLETDESVLRAVRKISALGPP